MRSLLFIILFLASGCTTKKVCINQLENNRSIYDVDNSCHVRIRQVIVGSETEVPSSIGFKSGTLWSYSWQESKFENGKFSSGHFILIPITDQNPKVSNGN